MLRGFLLAFFLPVLSGGASWHSENGSSPKWQRTPERTYVPQVEPARAKSSGCTPTEIVEFHSAASEPLL